MNQEKQRQQDALWDAYQNDQAFANYGCPSGGRHKFLADQVNAGLAVLNIGVGHGSLERMLVGRRAVVSCLDPSARSIDNIRTALGGRIDARVGHAQNIPWGSHEFDVVIMTEVLEHIESEVITVAVKEVARVLKPSGKFLGTVPAEEKLEASTVVCPKCSESFHRWGHMQSFTEKKLSILLRCGFSRTKVCRYAFGDWASLNFRGRTVHLARKLLTRVGAKLTDQHFAFEATAPLI